MSAYQIFQLPKQTQIDSSVRIVAGALANFYATGTTTKQDTFTTSALSVAHPNPVVADANGVFPAIYLDPTKVYKLTLTTSAAVLIYTIDPCNDQIITQALLGLYLYPQTAAEIAASVTPTFYYYPPGDIRRYGAVAGATNVRSNIQTALDVNYEVFVPDGTWNVDDAVQMNDYNILRFASRNARFVADYGGAIIEGKNTNTGAAANDVRRYHWQVHGGYLDGTDRTNSGSMGIDLRGSTMCKIVGTYITNVEKAVRGEGDLTPTPDLGCFYNDCVGVDITSVGYGYWFGTLANDNHVFGGRVTDILQSGTYDNDNSANTYVAVAIEGWFGFGHDNSVTAACFSTRYIASRLENYPADFPGAGDAVRIGATARDIYVEAPYISGVTGTGISDAGQFTNIVGVSEYWKIGGGSRIKKYQRVLVTRDVASFAAGAFRQEGPFTVSGIAVGDPCMVSLPAAWPQEIMVGVPVVSSANTVYLPMKNEDTGSARDPASGDFIFGYMSHGAP